MYKKFTYFRDILHAAIIQERLLLQQVQYAYKYFRNYWLAASTIRQIATRQKASFSPEQGPAGR